MLAGVNPIENGRLETRKGKVLRHVAANQLGRLPSATGALTRFAYRRAEAAGMALDPLLTHAGLTFQQIETPTARLNVEDQIKFLNQVARALDDELLGFHLAQGPDLREFGLMYYVLASSETMIDALQRGARYSTLVNEGILHKVVDGRDVGFSFDYVGVSRHLDRHQIEFWMTAIVRICRQLTGRPLLPSRVRLIHSPPAGGAELPEFFGDNVEFGATMDEIVFPSSARDLPTVTADPYLNTLLVGYCEEALSHRPKSRSSFRASVENAAVALLPHKKARAAEMARRLGMSQRTFSRRLALEGTTFSALLESLRSDLARRYLSDENLSISQIAWLLGYQEVGAFSHAFKRWTGKTPRETRGLLPR